LNIGHNPLECNQNERFDWLLRQKYDIFDRVLEPYCENGTLLWDLNSESSAGSTAPSTPTPETTTTENFAYNLNSCLIFVLITGLIPFIISVSYSR